MNVQRYTVHRKLPMLVARTERTLAIDGDYIHVSKVPSRIHFTLEIDGVASFPQIMPSTNKARGVFDSGKTASYNMKSVSKCNSSGSSFKIIFKRDMGEKRYEFEAESARTAGTLESLVFFNRTKSELTRLKPRLLPLYEVYKRGKATLSVLAPSTNRGGAGWLLDTIWIDQWTIPI